MWFNSMQPDEPYQDLHKEEVLEIECARKGTSLQVVHGCRQLVS